MKKSFYLAAGLLILASGFQFGKAQDKAATRTLKVTVHYAGSGTVDDKHKIQVFLFDSPDFAQGNAMPTGMQMTADKNGTVTFSTSPARRFTSPLFTTPPEATMAHPARRRPALPWACTPKSPRNPRR